MSDDQMQVVMSRRDGEVIVSVRGEIDLSSAPALRATLDECLDSGDSHVVIDLTETTLVDSTVLGVIISAQRRFQQAGGAIVLRSPDDQVRRVLEVTGLHRVFTIED